MQTLPFLIRTKYPTPCNIPGSGSCHTCDFLWGTQTREDGFKGQAGPGWPRWALPRVTCGDIVTPGGFGAGQVKVTPVGWGDSASAVVLENCTAPVFSGKHYHQHILACNLASFIILQRWLHAYGAFLRYLERAVVFQGSISHGGQGRENPESFWHSDFTEHEKHNVGRLWHDLLLAQRAREGNVAGRQD